MTGVFLNIAHLSVGYGWYILYSPLLRTTKNSRGDNPVNRMALPDFFYHIFNSLSRQGPGSSEATRKAWSHMEPVPYHPKILDIGCGSGTQTRDLAGLCDGIITAVDTYQPFLDRVVKWAETDGIADRIITVHASMDCLPFSREEFDIIWSEGAIDIMGFEKGLSDWKRFCKKGGHLVVSDITLFDPLAPDELISFWNMYGVTLYTEEEKESQIRDADLSLVARFRLEEAGWVDQYYNPILKKISELTPVHGSDPECAAILTSLMNEAEIYRKFGRFFGYTFFVIQNKSP